MKINQYFFNKLMKFKVWVNNLQIKKYKELIKQKNKIFNLYKIFRYVLVIKKWIILIIWFVNILFKTFKFLKTSLLKISFA